jgi:hypothetical protein
MVRYYRKREFIKISERPGGSKELGIRLVQQQQKLFVLWQRVRDGTLAHDDCEPLVKDIRCQIVSVLQAEVVISDESHSEKYLASNTSCFWGDVPEGRTP